MPGYVNPFETSPDTPGPVGVDPDFYLNQDPEAGFWKYLQSQGLNRFDQDPVSRFAQGSYNRIYNNYRAIAAEDPNMGFYDYLQKNKPDLRHDYGALAPEQRGDFSSRILTPRARWVVG